MRGLAMLKAERSHMGDARSSRDELRAQVIFLSVIPERFVIAPYLQKRITPDRTSTTDNHFREPTRLTSATGKHDFTPNRTDIGFNMPEHSRKIGIQWVRVVIEHDEPCAAGLLCTDIAGGGVKIAIEPDRGHRYAVLKHFGQRLRAIRRIIQNNQFGQITKLCIKLPQPTQCLAELCGAIPRRDDEAQVHASPHNSTNELTRGCVLGLGIERNCMRSVPERQMSRQLLCPLKNRLGRNR